jgi:hypothetical protein
VGCSPDKEGLPEMANCEDGRAETIADALTNGPHVEV